MAAPGLLLFPRLEGEYWLVSLAGQASQPIQTKKILLFFDVSPSDFRPSRKQAQCTGILDEDVLETLRDVEAMAATSWLVCFLLCQHDSSIKEVRAKGCQMLASLASYVSEPLGVLGAVGEDLPHCDALKAADGNCVHLSMWLGKLRRTCGETWQERPTDVILSIERGDCATLDGFSYQIFWQLVESLDARIIGDGLSDSMDGVPVLSGKKRARRLTKHWQNWRGVGVTTKDGKKLFSSSVARSDDPIRTEDLRLGKYYGALTAAVSQASHICL